MLGRKSTRSKRTKSIEVFCTPQARILLLATDRHRLAFYHFINQKILALTAMRSIDHYSQPPNQFFWWYTGCPGTTPSRAQRPRPLRGPVPSIYPDARRPSCASSRGKSWTVHCTLALKWPPPQTILANDCCADREIPPRSAAEKMDKPATMDRFQRAAPRGCSAPTLSSNRRRMPAYMQVAILKQHACELLR